LNPPTKQVSARFAPLFTLAITHQYVDGGAYDAFAVTPLGETEKVLRRHGWVGAHTGNTFTLYANLVRTSPILNQQTKVTVNEPNLFYAIEFSDADFAKYTDLPMRQGWVLCTKPSLEAANHPGHASAALSLDPVEVTEETFPFPVASLKLRPFHIVLSLSTRLLQERLAASAAGSWDAGRRLRLELPARSTIWRYDIFNHGGNAAHQHEIQPIAAGAGQPVFHRVKGISGPDRETSLAFESETPIPLAARPSQRFTLLRDKHPLISELPAPGLSFTHRAGGAGLCSNLFIYL